MPVQAVPSVDFSIAVLIGHVQNQVVGLGISNRCTDQESDQQAQCKDGDFHRRSFNSYETIVK